MEEVVSPQHYQMANGAQVIDITSQLDFCAGNVVKYVCRAGRKPGAPKLVDLMKAKFYLDKLIELEGGSDVGTNAHCS